MKTLRYFIVLIVGFAFGRIYQSKENYKITPSTLSAQETKAKLLLDTTPSSEKTTDQKITVQATSSQEQQPDDVVSMKERFEQIYFKKNLSEAAILLDQMQQKWPQSSQYLEARSRLLVRTRDWEKAKEVLKECVNLYPNSKSCLLDLASTELQIGSKEEQQGVIMNCNAKLPQNPECQNMLGLLRINQGRFLEAAAIYKQLIENNGSYGIRFNDGMLHSQLAIALDGAGRHDEAKIYFQKACQRNWANACERLSTF